MEEPQTKVVKTEIPIGLRPYFQEYDPDLLNLEKDADLIVQRALAYFEDAEALPMPRMIDRTPWPAMKRFLEHQALEAGRKRLQDLWE